MGEAYDRLRDGLPRFAEDRTGRFDDRPRAVREWVERLPMANTVAAARQVLEALARSNSRRLAPLSRMGVLDELRRPASVLASACLHGLARASFPLPPEVAGLAGFAQSLHERLALGYRIALVELCAPHGRIPMFRTGAAAVAAVRTLQHGGASHGASSLAYRNPPEGFWLGLHQVYRFAAAAGIDAIAVGDPLARGETTARAAYTAALLLDWLRPRSLTVAQLLEVIDHCGLLAAHCRLTDSMDEGMPVVRTDVDGGPMRRRAEGRDAGVGDFALDLSGLRKLLAQDRTGLRPDRTLSSGVVSGWKSPELPRELLDRIDGGGRMTERGHVRLAGGYRLDAAVGLHDLHLVLAGGEYFDAFCEGRYGTVEHGRGAELAALRGVGAVDAVRTASSRALVLDQGLGGYRVAWIPEAGNLPVRVRVGEVVGLGAPDGGDAAGRVWLVGSIRWIEAGDDGRVEAGIELLSRRALPVAVRDPGRPAAAPQRGILLGPLRDIDRRDYVSLLVPGTFDRDAGMVEVACPPDTRTFPGLPASTEEITGLELLDEGSGYRVFALPRVGAMTVPGFPEGITDIGDNGRVAASGDR